MLQSQTYIVEGYRVERIVGRFSKVRWQCNCPTFNSPPPRWLYPWCRHVMSVMSQQQSPIHIAAEADELLADVMAASPAEPVPERPAAREAPAAQPLAFRLARLVGT